jgi:AcrR family transcriptional regulator
MGDIKKKVLDVSRELFLLQGYQKTTTRQILAKAGIKNSSLYHFFKSKEHIFLHLASEVYEDMERGVDVLMGRGKNLVLKWALAFNLEFYAVEKHERLTELIYEAYRSSTILNLLAQKGAESFKRDFEWLNPDFTDQDYFVRSMAVKSCVFGFISDQYHKGNISYHDKIATILELTLSLFNAPKKDIKKALKKSSDIIKKNKIVISGFSI